MRFETTDVEVWVRDQYGNDLTAEIDSMLDSCIRVGACDSSSTGGWARLTPEEAVRFGFHLAGLGAKALRAQR